MKLNVMAPSPEKVNELDARNLGPILGMSVEEFEKLVETVMILIPHRAKEGLVAPLAQTFGMWARWGATIATVEDNFGGFIEITRAGMCRSFIEYTREHPNVDKMVMVDADESVPYDAPFRLALWDLPVVSGVVCTYSENRGIFACFTKLDEHGIARFPSYNFTKTMPARGLVKAHSVGTGLICIKKVVLEKIYDSGQVPFYIPEEHRRQVAHTGMLSWGEDIAFSRQCDALGFDRHVDLSVRATHYKTMPITWPRIALDFELDAKDWNVSPKDYRHG